ncbi:hypothetical protein C8R44DRAFT_870817 [Mycena epipterygia]|nr:hypothetical protein C8R44DRAFT_870817 [Mycena epipterygia]
MLLFVLRSLWILDVAAAITIYGQILLGITSARAPTVTLAAAPAPATSFALSVPSVNTSVPGLSIPVPGTFFGFSIEMSVITQLCGKNSSYFQVPLLNLMEYAYYVPTLPEGRAISRDKANTNNPTLTPSVIYTMDLFYMLSNISSLVNVKWCSIQLIGSYPTDNCYPEYAHRVVGSPVFLTAGGALWALDYGLQMAYSNFSGAMLHVGGQNVFYNPFTVPPTNVSRYYDWTVGTVYYSALISAEVFGKTNTSQIIDLRGNNASEYTPCVMNFASNGAIARVALFNYITDATGASNYTATTTVSGGTVPSTVQVKYFLSDSVSTKNNITWAGQTLGTVHEVDGRFKGNLNIVAGVCARVLEDGGGHQHATTAYTNTRGTATIASAVLETSNGMSGKDWQQHQGSTSSGERDSGASADLCVNFGSVLFGTAIALLGLSLSH